MHSQHPEIVPRVTVIVNMYCNPARLFVGGEEILSGEGTSQGDPLAMPMYALGIAYHSSVKPQCLKSFNPGMQVIQWLAVLLSSYTVGGRYSRKCYGYYINALKLVLVKPSFEAEAREAFKDTAIQIMIDGCRHLGAVLGTDDYCRQYVSLKVEDWCHEVRQLAASSLCCICSWSMIQVVVYCLNHAQHR